MAVQVWKSAQVFEGQFGLTAHYATLQDQTARNRINQRNFRSRRQQYIKELEERLRVYEQAGVQATSRVQVAARVVARENAMLRNLVRETTGCTERQLNSYLSFALQPVPERPGETRALGHPFPRIETSPSIILPADKNVLPVAESRLEPNYVPRPNPHGSANPDAQMRSHIDSDRGCHANSTLHSPSDKILADLDGGESTATAQDVTDLESHRSVDSGSAEVEGNQWSECDRQQGPSMSCEEAAAIISSIRITEGPCDIREQLGCTSIGTCNVNNMEVFQVMGEAI